MQLLPNVGWKIRIPSIEQVSAYMAIEVRGAADSRDQTQISLELTQNQGHPVDRSDRQLVLIATGLDSSPAEYVKVPERTPLLVERQRLELAQGCPHEPCRVNSLPQQMTYQQLLSPLIRLSEKRLTKLTQVTIGLPWKSIPEVLLPSDTAVDDIRTEVVEKLN